MALHDCLFNSFAATLHIGGCSSIRKLRTRLAVVTGTHYIKIYNKVLKTLLHVSIIRSSSGSLLCSLLNLQFKTFNNLFCYINLVLWQHVVCESDAVQLTPAVDVLVVPYSMWLDLARNKMCSLRMIIRLKYVGEI